MLTVLKTYLVKAILEDNREVSLRVSEKDLDSLLRTLRLNGATKVEYSLRERGKPINTTSSRTDSYNYPREKGITSGQK